MSRSKLAKTIRVVLIVSLVLCLAAVGLGLAVADRLYERREQLVQEFARGLGINLEFDALDVALGSAAPQICARNLRLKQPLVRVSAQRACASVLIRASIDKRAVVLGDVELDRLNVEVLAASGEVSSGQSASPEEATRPIQQTLHSLRRVLPSIEIRQATFRLPVGANFFFETPPLDAILSPSQASIHAEVSWRGSSGKKSSIVAAWTENSAGDAEIRWTIDAHNLDVPLMHLLASAPTGGASQANGRTKLCARSDDSDCRRLEDLAGQGQVTVAAQAINSESHFSKLTFGDVSARVDLVVKGDEKTKTFDVTVDKVEGNGTQILSVLDPEWIGVEVFTWLKKNLLGPRVSKGRVLIAGDFSGNISKLDVSVSIDAQALAFLPDWPKVMPLSCSLEVDLKHLLVKNCRGRTAGIDVDQASFEIPSFAHVDVQSRVALRAVGSFAKTLDYLSDTPLRSVVADTMKMVPVSGQATTTRLELEIPLAKSSHKAISVNGETTIDDASVETTDHSLGIKGAKAALQFSSSVGTRAAPSVKVSGEVVGLASGAIRISDKFFGVFSIDTAKRWLGMRVAVSGSARPQLPEKSGITIDTTGLKGNLDLRNPNGRGHWHVQVDHVVLTSPSLSSSESDKQSSATSSPPKSKDKASRDCDPRELPSFDVAIAKFELNGQTIGSGRIVTEKSKRGLVLKEAMIKGSKSTIALNSGAWEVDVDGRHRSSIAGSWKSPDAGTILKASGLYEDLESGSIDVAFNLGWPGGPSEASAKTIYGTVTPLLKDGYLKSAGGVLIKLADLLTLNLLQIYKQGAKLKTLDGKLVFKDGIVTMAPLTIDLSSTVSRLNGRLDLERQEVDSRGSLNLNFTDPADQERAKGSFLDLGILKRILDFTFLNRLTGFSFNLVGPWQKPEVTGIRYSPFGLGDDE